MMCNSTHQGSVFSILFPLLESSPEPLTLPVCVWKHTVWELVVTAESQRERTFPKQQNSNFCPPKTPEKVFISAQFNFPTSRKKDLLFLSFKQTKTRQCFMTAVNEDGGRSGRWIDAREESRCEGMYSSALMFRLQSSAVLHFEGNTTHWPDADSKFTGNALIYGNAWRETNWNTSTCHSIDLHVSGASGAELCCSDWAVGLGSDCKASLCIYSRSDSVLIIFIHLWRPGRPEAVGTPLGAGTRRFPRGEKHSSPQCVRRKPVFITTFITCSVFPHSSIWLHPIQSNYFYFLIFFICGRKQQNLASLIKQDSCQSISY